MIEVAFDMEKLRRPNSGLGQFCKHLGQSIQTENKEFNLTFYEDASDVSNFDGANTIQWNRKDALFGVKTSAHIWHCMHQEAKYLPKNKNTKIVLTIHDLNFLDKYTGSKRNSKLKKLQQLVNRASAITFISNYTRKIAEENLNLPDVPQEVIYNGIALTDVTAQKPGFVDQTDFIFSIGIIGQKKNFHVLVEAIKQLPDLKLYLCGNNSSDYAKSIKSKVAELGLENQVIMPGEISEAEKNWMYANCKTFVFPSLSEGFGLPVVEAMHYGKPVVISNKTSLPEIAGDEGIVLENFEPDYIASQIQLSIDSFSSEKEKALKKRASEFSWSNAAKDYIRIYKTLSGQD